MIGGKLFGSFASSLLLLGELAISDVMAYNHN